MNPTFIGRRVFFGLWLALAVVDLPLWAAEGDVQFNRDVRPILSENCYVCHGPDKNKRKAELRLDVRESAVEHKAIVPGKPQESKLIERIAATDPDEVMPPPATHKKLSAAQKETLRRWIASGAEYQPHWAFIPPKRPPPPTVKKPDWVRTPIDAFILANLEGRGIAPSPEAHPAALLRRLSLDLTGLPPTPAEVAEFVRDPSPAGYERAVDRLLASPHFGERMAVWWLDLARYADTVGYHGDQNVNAWPYRDYVIEAFNSNKPFDQFTTEQLAGDLLPNSTPQQRVATAFNRLNMVTREGGAQPKEYLAKYASDRVRTVGGAFLGVTLGCAECHDHKYDPFTMRDFYSLSAFFADVKQWGVYNDYGYTPNPDLKGWSNDHPFPPEMELESPALLRRRDAIRNQMGQLYAASLARLPANPKVAAQFDIFRHSLVDFLKSNPTGWIAPPLAVATAAENTPDKKPALPAPAETPPKPAPKDKPKKTDNPKPAKSKAAAAKAKPAAPAGPAADLTRQPDGSLLVSAAAKKGQSIQFDLELPAVPLVAMRLELLPHAAHGGAIVRGGEATTVELTAALRTAAKGNAETPIAFALAEADHKQPQYANGYEVLGLKGGWRTVPALKSQRHTAVYLLDKPVTPAAGDSLRVTMTGDIGCVRLSLSPLADRTCWQSDLNPKASAELVASAGAASGEAARLAGGAFLLASNWEPAAVAQWRNLYREELELRGGKTHCVVTQAWEPRVARIHPRGNWQDESGPLVQPAVPQFLASSAGPAADKRLTRLDLARWITAADNPLTARVFVNRQWKLFFGAGLSNVLEDVGAQGEWPVHPALLDWLAVEFRESGWNVKHLVKLLVMSSTYRQDSKARLDLKDVDPQNRWLAAQSPRRLEAEFVRDNALAVAGLLHRELGGPSVRPYQPAGYYVNLQFPNRDYTAQLDERQYRRGLYTHWQRTFLHPMLANFDAPSREECACTRTAANTPQQALTLLNDPTFVEAARALAQNLQGETLKSDPEKFRWLYTRVLARAPREKESESLAAFLKQQRDYYAQNPAEAEKLLRVGEAPRAAGEATELAAWTTVARVLLNLHETITRY